MITIGEMMGCRNDEVKAYEKPSDVRLPFGDCVGHRDGEQYYEVCKDSISGLNYIREHAESVTADELNKLCPSLKQDKVKNFLLNHASRVKLINTGSWRTVSDGIIGTHTSIREKEIIRDVKYGFSDVIMYATFDYQRMCVRLHVDCCKFNRHYQHAEYGKLMSMTDGNGYNLTQDDMLRYISSMINEIEFLPFCIDTYDGCRVSHKAYRDSYGMKHDAVTSPCLGVNIKKHNDIMNRFSKWVGDGGYIKDDIFYLICEDRECREKLYLRRFTDWSPKPAKTA